MHKLDRPAVAAPTCLNNYDHRTQDWDDICQNCKGDVRQQLSLLQGRPTSGQQIIGLRCAYCENDIYHGGHIEHFRRKNRKIGFPHLTFTWSNLFLSCDASQHCGHYKDRPGGPAYNPDLLVKPDIDDPDKFLYFHSNGEVRPREGLSPADHQRAEMTIEVFGLRNGGLVGARKRAAKKYLKLVSELHEMLSAEQDEGMREYALDDLQKYCRDEITNTQWDAYATTIRHFLRR
ncbi:MAG TPA: TIGR02646 family protein [Azospirillaceae bacterium]|nr:TIGR02646 family protein [Azospirillaceae bacterium]HRQ80981.1 TIGR02646 family protein [Azospirillaceae bacterium]